MNSEIVFGPQTFLNELELKKVDIRSLFTVFGYIRKEQQTLNHKESYNVIPKLVCCIVLAFYTNHVDSFEIAGKDVKISGDNKIITKLVGGRNNTSIGKISIPSQCNIICRWNLKINVIDDWYMYIGITSDHSSNDLNFCENRKTSNYACYALSSVLKSKDQNKHNYGTHVSWEQGEIVGMELNLVKKNISFYVNNKYQGVAYENIDIGENIQYRLAVCMYGKDNQIELKDFEILSGSFQNNLQ